MEIGETIFGSDRSSRNANLRSSVRPSSSSLYRAVNLHHSGSNLQSGISQQSVSTRRALSEHSENQNKSQYSWSL